MRKHAEANDWRYNYLKEKELERSLSAEKETLNNKVNILNSQVLHKEVEANNWRRSYAEENI